MILPITGCTPQPSRLRNVGGNRPVAPLRDGGSWRTYSNVHMRDMKDRRPPLWWRIWSRIGLKLLRN